jgi:hypothetical protein
MKAVKLEIDRRHEQPLDEASVPDAFLPEQYFDRLSARNTETPEKRLMFAILVDAVIQLQRRNTAGAAEAERWVRGEGEEEPLFSFRDVCTALQIEPDYLSRGLLGRFGKEAPQTVPVPIRQLRTSHRKITALRKRRRRRGARAVREASAATS